MGIQDDSVRVGVDWADGQGVAITGLYHVGQRNRGLARGRGFQIGYTAADQEEYSQQQ
jgi:hypothetical protein